MMMMMMMSFSTAKKSSFISFRSEEKKLFRAKTRQFSVFENLELFLTAKRKRARRTRFEPQMPSILKKTKKKKAEKGGKHTKLESPFLTL
jgi:hypothetical protein